MKWKTTGLGCLKILRPQLGTTGTQERQLPSRTHQADEKMNVCGHHPGPQEPTGLQVPPRVTEGRGAGPLSYPRRLGSLPDVCSACCTLRLSVHGSQPCGENGCRRVGVGPHSGLELEPPALHLSQTNTAPICLHPFSASGPQKQPSLQEREEPFRPVNIQGEGLSAPCEPHFSAGISGVCSVRPREERPAGCLPTGRAARAEISQQRHSRRDSPRGLFCGR